MAGAGERKVRELNSYRRDLIRECARKLTIELWRLLQKRHGKSLSALEILPIEPRLIAPELLGLTYDEPYEIGSVGGVEIAGLVERETKRVVISQKLPAEVRRFTGAHEVAHWVLHPAAMALRESPATDRALRSPFRTAREREADLFAADLVMPVKAVEEAYAKLFGAPLDGSRIDQDQAFCLTNGNRTAADLAQMTAEERARLIADSYSLVDRHARSLAEIFGVSTNTMAYQLLDIGLVS
jgi:hypothetical protein